MRSRIWAGRGRPGRARGGRSGSARGGRTDLVDVGGFHVVLGATGGAGRALVGELARQGHRVRAVSRRARGSWPDGVEAVPADLMNSEDVRRACRAAAV